MKFNECKVDRRRFNSESIIGRYLNDHSGQIGRNYFIIIVYYVAEFKKTFYRLKERANKNNAEFLERYFIFK